MAIIKLYERPFVFCIFPYINLIVQQLFTFGHFRFIYLEWTLNASFPWLSKQGQKVFWSTSAS